MKRSDFRYELPPERIAQVPSDPRDASRLLFVSRDSTCLRDGIFEDLPALLGPGDLLVVNDTRVVPARLRGVKESGGRAEVLLLRREGPDVWEALVRGSKRSRPGTRIRVAESASVAVVDVRGSGRYGVRIEAGGRDPEDLLEAVGEVPLPPYIRRDRVDPSDRERYQTLFARPEKAGSAAAPTAGLHFTSRLASALRVRGIDWVTVTLHIGLGTFLPVRSDEVTNHRMHPEWYEVPSQTAEAVNRALNEGRRVVAVGTTATRVLEHCGKAGSLEPGSGWTDLFIVPGHRFQIVKGLVTNFHLPESTLLMLACAFGGTERILSAYRHAVSAEYRFYSYGDAMLVL